jgi:Protein of unknown function (DUF1585)
VGRKRASYADGTPVDLTGEFKDGSTIVGADGLLTYLQSQGAKVMTTLARKMLGYALGRNPQASDRPLVREMSESSGDASFSDLASRLVTSRQFRYRGGGGDAGPTHKVQPKPAAGVGASPLAESP